MLIRNGQFPLISQSCVCAPAVARMRNLEPVKKAFQKTLLLVLQTRRQIVVSGQSSRPSDENALRSEAILGQRRDLALAVEDSPCMSLSCSYSIKQ